MTYLYFLFSEKDLRWYIGQTTLTPFERLEWHNKGRVASTKPRRPFSLAYFEEHPNRQVATKREWHLKHPSGYREKLFITTNLQSDKKSWPMEGPFIFESDQAQLGPKGALRA